MYRREPITHLPVHWQIPPWARLPATADASLATGLVIAVDRHPHGARPTPLAGAVLVEGSHRRGDGHGPLAAQAPVEEAVLRDGLLGESEQLERPRHGDPGHSDERRVAGLRGGDT